MTTNHYTFNGDGQRVQIVDSQGTKKPIWDFENTLLETDGSNSTQVIYTLEPAGYGNLISQRRSSTTSFYLFDALGSTRKLTNSAGNISDSYDFRAYGETFAFSGSTVNVFRWVGELGYYLDIDRLAYYLRARPYNPSIAKFLSEDPLGFFGSPWNLYEYVRSRPTWLVDPLGESGFCGDDCPQAPGGIANYGCYCGFGNRPGPGPGPPRPIDPVDGCCQEHDACFGRSGCRDVLDRRPPCLACNRVFCRCLRFATCNRYGGGPDFQFCEAYKRAAMGLFGCAGFGINPPEFPIH
jgi:RHS repeat-associated protein